MRQTVKEPVNFSDPKWINVNASVRKLIKGMLQKKPEDRISLEEVI